MPGGPGGFDPSALLGMLGGPGFWDNPLVSSIAFHPSRVEPSFLEATSGPIRDGTFDVPGGDKVAYRLYLPPGDVKAVVYYFHENAGTCVGMDDLKKVFDDCSAALLSIDYRGYAWSTGQPSISKLCGDVDAVFAASLPLLERSGCGGAKLVSFGRSIGAASAVHLAAKHADRIHGLILDSGMMSIKQMPMVQMIAQQMLGPQGMQMIQQMEEPTDVFSKLPAIACPLLVMHGEKDEMIPVKQGIDCFERCQSQQKTIRQWERAGHNDVLVFYMAEYVAAITALIGQAVAFENPFPAGALVEAHSLSTAALNGLRGRVLGPQQERLRVEFPSPHGEKALKPANLKIVDEGD